TERAPAARPGAREERPAMLSETCANGWCYQHNGQTRGPVSPAQLKGLLVSGLILPQQAVWKHGGALPAFVTVTAAVLSGEEEGQGGAGLAGHQLDVPAGAEADPVRGQVAEVVVAHLRILVGFRDVHRHPALALGVELGPAVIAGHLARAVLFRQREADLELG